MWLLVNHCFRTFFCIWDPVHAADRAWLLQNDGVKSIFRGVHAPPWAVMKNLHFSTRCGRTVLVEHSSGPRVDWGWKSKNATSELNREISLNIYPFATVTGEIKISTMGLPWGHNVSFAYACGPFFFHLEPPLIAEIRRTTLLDL